MNRLFYGLAPVCLKEFLHIVRDRGTLFFALLIPMLQLFLFGFAVDTNVRQIATVVFDESRTQESRRLLDRFAASDVFDLRIYARSPAELYEAIRAGKARAGVRIQSRSPEKPGCPAEFSKCEELYCDPRSCLPNTPVESRGIRKGRLQKLVAST